MPQLDLPYGSTILPVNIPDEYLGQIALPAPVSPAHDVQELIHNAIRQPIGSPPLEELIHSDHRIAIIVDDYTRGTPVAKLLPTVLEILEIKGVTKGQIQIIVASGTHRLMTPEELEQKVGPSVVGEYEIINTPADDQDAMEYLGTSSNGIPAWVNRQVAKADVRIGLGMITPHCDAGFSGGSKIILPGVCSMLTVNAFHVAGAFLGETQLGMEDSPLRLNLETFVSERIPLSFIVNVILDIEKEIIQCVAGHPVQAHRKGIEYAKGAFGVPIQKRYDIVVANCYPYDVDLWQSTKGVFCGSLVTADGGTLIMLTADTEGNSNYPLFPQYIGTEREELERMATNPEVPHAILIAESIRLAKLRERVRLAIVSEGLPEASSKEMKIPRFPSVEEAIEDAIENLPISKHAGSICLFPQAGITLPLVHDPA
jgi:nickel-dependent lactate racemase